MITLTKWTLDDYHNMINTGILDDRQVEFILGDIVDMSPEKPLHHYTNHNVVKYLRSLLQDKAEVMEAHPITLTNSEPKPDVEIVRCPQELYLDHHPYPEDIYWIIEIADTTSSKDLGIKKQMYAQANIPEYWVIDLKNTILRVFRQPHQDNYQTELEFQDGIISPLSHDDINVVVNKLLNLEDTQFG